MMLLYSFLIAVVTMIVMATFYKFIPSYRESHDWLLSVLVDKGKEPDTYKKKRTWVPGMEGQELWEFLFYELGLMPCCRGNMGYYEGPSGGMSQNIKCGCCGHKWNMTAGFIKRLDNIGGAMPVMAPHMDDPHFDEAMEMMASAKEREATNEGSG